MGNFIWASKRPLDEVATIYEANITLNKSASAYFETAYVVLLGLDREARHIAVKPVSKSEVEQGFIPVDQQHNITVKPSYARVCNKQFVEEVAALAGLRFGQNEGYKFTASWSDKDNALIIDLNRKGE